MSPNSLRVISKGLRQVIQFLKWLFVRLIVIVANCQFQLSFWQRTSKHANTCFFVKGNTLQNKAEFFISLITRHTIIAYLNEQNEDDFLVISRASPQARANCRMRLKQSVFQVNGLITVSGQALDTVS